MKRKDAFRKLQTICQRLDTLGTDVLLVNPLELYLFGSVLTDKPNPADIDLLLVYELPPDFDYAREAQAFAYHTPRASDRVVIELRRRMKFIRMFTARNALRNWDQDVLLLTGLKLRRIWTPALDWQAHLATIEANPTPYVEHRNYPTDEELYARYGEYGSDTYKAGVAAAIAALEEA